VYLELLSFPTRRSSDLVLDRDGDKIRWSLTPLGESGIRQNPTGLTLDPDTGLVDWAAGSASAALGLYAVSVKIEDLDENDHAKRSEEHTSELQSRENLV